MQWVTETSDESVNIIKAYKLREYGRHGMNIATVIRIVSVHSESTFDILRSM